MSFKMGEKIKGHEIKPETAMAAAMTKAGVGQGANENDGPLPFAAKGASPAPLPAPAPLRSLSVDERAKVRRAIETHFDDGIGQYLDGKSDQSIGDSLNVPRKWVEMIREAAYGPIRVTPQMLTLRREVEAHGVRLNEAMAQAKSAVEVAERAVAAIAQLVAAQLSLADQVNTLIEGVR
jgi:hypothetical protein